MLKDKIKQVRIKAGLRQEELAKMLSVHQQAVSNWENGISRPGIEKLQIISKELNVPAAYWFDEENTEVEKIKNYAVAAIEEKFHREISR